MSDTDPDKSRPQLGESSDYPAEIDALIDAAIDDELDLDQAAQLDAYVLENDACRARLEGLREVRSLLGELGDLSDESEAGEAAHSYEHDADSAAQITQLPFDEATRDSQRSATPVVAHFQFSRIAAAFVLAAMLGLLVWMTGAPDRERVDVVENAANPNAVPDETGTQAPKIQTLAQVQPGITIREPDTEDDEDESGLFVVTVPSSKPDIQIYWIYQDGGHAVASK